MAAKWTKIALLILNSMQPVYRNDLRPLVIEFLINLTDFEETIPGIVIIYNTILVQKGFKNICIPTEALNYITFRTGSYI